MKNKWIEYELNAKSSIPLTDDGIVIFLKHELIAL